VEMGSVACRNQADRVGVALLYSITGGLPRDSG
jgi:hypothetical protein